MAEEGDGEHVCSNRGVAPSRKDANADCPRHWRRNDGRCGEWFSYSGLRPPSLLRTSDGCERLLADPNRIRSSMRRDSGRAAYLTRLTSHRAVEVRRDLNDGPAKLPSASALNLVRVRPPVLGESPWIST
jgi:hypothetical protein